MTMNGGLANNYFCADQRRAVSNSLPPTARGRNVLFLASGILFKASLRARTLLASAEDQLKCRVRQVRLRIRVCPEKRETSQRAWLSELLHTRMRALRYETISGELGSPSF